MAGVARGSHGVPRGSHGVPHQMLKSVARLGATLLSICAELRALRREAQALESFAKLKLCARLDAQRHLAEPSTDTSAPKAEKITEGGKYTEGEQIAETKKWPYLDA